MDQDAEILLIEDNGSDAEMTIRALKKNNLAGGLLHLKDGVAALNYIFATGEYAGRNIENKPKLILLDLKMPRVNGIEVLQKIKNDERTKRIPVVMLTSSKEDPDILACYEMGANSYIVKPVNFEQFQKTIADLGLYWMKVNRLLR